MQLLVGSWSSLVSLVSGGSKKSLDTEWNFSSIIMLFYFGSCEWMESANFGNWWLIFGPPQRVVRIVRINSCEKVRFHGGLKEKVLFWPFTKRCVLLLFSCESLRVCKIEIEKNATVQSKILRTRTVS